MLGVTTLEDEELLEEEDIFTGVVEPEETRVGDLGAEDNFVGVG